ncbi:unnamed protein product [marine sediment metagenome]|uniref:Glycosyltransferase 2-like domain-containing protein n=1 Tax=marine sediment metagenome TaxID=412755 RepID=X0Z1B7_9ZZZZ
MNEESNFKKVSIIIVSYNSSKFIFDCINSIRNQEYPYYEIIVVDNASIDNSVSLIKNNFPDIQIYESSKNLGFAGAVNLGVNLSSGDIIVLLNPDVVVKENWLLTLTEAFQNEQVGVVGSIILDSNQSFIQHAGAVIHKNGLTEHIELSFKEVSLTDNEKLMEKIKEKIKKEFEKTDIDYVTGASMAIRRSLWDKLCGFDEKYFPGYFEETDFCIKIKNLGYKVILEPKSVCIHKQASSSGLFSSTFYYFYHKNRIRFIFKNYSFRKFINVFLPSEINWIRRKRISKENIPLLKAYLINIINIFSILYRKRKYIS